MRIVLSCRIHPKHRPGGMPFVVHDRATALSALGHDVHLVTTGGIKETGEVYQLHSVKDSPPEIHSREYAEGCRNLCRDLQPVLIHLDSFHRNQMWWLDKPGETKRVGITLHGFGWGAFLTRWNLYRCGESSDCKFDAKDIVEEIRALQKIDVIIGVSKHEYSMLSEYYGLPHAKLVYNPIPDYFFSETKKFDANAPWLCASITGQNKRGFHLAEKASKKTGIPIKIISEKSRPEMVGEYDNSRGLIVPTFYSQGYDLSVAEALTRGRPVIASNVGSYRAESSEYPSEMFSLFTCGQERELETLMKKKFNPLPVDTEKHRPKNHAENWLEVMCAS